MKKFTVLTVVLLVVALTLSFALFGCTKDDNVIEVNEVTHSVFYAPLYVAINNGYFEEEGLEISLTNGGGSDKTMTAVVAGQADIGLCGPETAVYEPASTDIKKTAVDSGADLTDTPEYRDFSVRYDDFFDKNL